MASTLAFSPWRTRPACPDSPAGLLDRDRIPADAAADLLLAQTLKVLRSFTPRQVVGKPDVGRPSVLITAIEPA